LNIEKDDLKGALDINIFAQKEARRIRSKLDFDGDG